MQTFIQSKVTKRFFDAEGKVWKQRQRAKGFENSIHAARACLRFNLTNVQLLLRWSESDQARDVVIPFETRKTGLGYLSMQPL